VLIHAKVSYLAHYAQSKPAVYQSSLLVPAQVFDEQSSLDASELFLMGQGRFQSLQESGAGLAGAPNSAHLGPFSVQ